LAAISSRAVAEMAASWRGKFPLKMLAVAAMAENPFVAINSDCNFFGYGCTDIAEIMREASPQKDCSDCSSADLQCARIPK